MAIQDAFGWESAHLHEFRVRFPGKDLLCTIGSDPDRSAELGQAIQTDYEERDERLRKWITRQHSFAKYLYDFGDNWWHSLRLEAVTSINRHETYPLCVAGRRACPPEDCGGADGYMTILRRFQGKPINEAWRVSMTDEWMLRLKHFKPDAFSPSEVTFRDPQTASYAIEDEF